MPRKQDGPQGRHVWPIQSCWRAAWGLKRDTRPLLAVVEIVSVMLTVCVCVSHLKLCKILPCAHNRLSTINILLFWLVLYRLTYGTGDFPGSLLGTPLLFPLLKQKVDLPLPHQSLRSLRFCVPPPSLALNFPLLSIRVLLGPLVSSAPPLPRKAVAPTSKMG